MRCWLIAGCLIVATAGCGGSGPKTFEVTGTVTLDDDKIPEGDIIFHPEDKKLGSQQGKIKDGVYTIKATPGTHKVEIRAFRLVPGKKGPMGEDYREQYIPDNYNDKTTLSVEVGDGKTKHDFPLKSKK